jgi:thiol-disulfide isomerase/thioredoxin
VKTTSKVLKIIREYGFLLLVVLILSVPQLRLFVGSHVQKGLLATGLLNAKVDINKTGVVTTPFELIDEYGNKVKLSELCGNKYFINIWATWCPPCVAELPGIDRLYQNTPKDKVSFIMLSVDDNFDKAIRFKQARNFHFPIYRLASRLPEELAGTSIPRTYVLDQSMEILITQEGLASYDHAAFRDFLLK